MYKIFLCFRYLTRKWIAFFAVAAVMLCTAMVLVVISVMGGFLDMVKERSRGLLADLIVDNYSLQGFPYYQEFIDQITTEMPDLIVAATPIVYNYGTLRFGDGITKPVYLVGTRLRESFDTNEFRESLYYEKYYPGTTSLAEQKQPTFGFDEDLNPLLPPDLEASLVAGRIADAAHAEQTGEEPDPAFIFERERGRHFLGPGLYDSPVFSAVYRLERIGRDLDDFAEELTLQLLQPPAQRDLEFSRAQLPSFQKDVARVRERIRPADLPEAVLEPLTQLEKSIDEFSAALDKNDAEWMTRLLDLMLASVQYQISELGELLGPGYVGREMPGVIIGRDMIGKPLEGSEYRRYYSRGERVIITMLPFTRKGSISPSGPISKAMRYVDDSRYGIYEIDSRNVYFDFEMAQKWLGMDSQKLDEKLGGGYSPPRATQIQIKLVADADLNEARDRVNAAWFELTRRLEQSPPQGMTDDDLMLMSNCSVETWEQRQGQYVAAVEKEKVLVTILFAIISVVAVFLVGVIFYMIVQQKTRDIGIVKSLGGTSIGVAAIFVGYGFLVGVVGAFLGLLSGTVFVRYINEIQDALADWNPELRVWSRETYIFDTIPNRVDPNEAAVIVIVAILASIVGSLVPAYRASRVWPVESLRYE